MAHYIDKDALVAEIEKWRDGIKKGILSIPLTGSDRAYATFEYEILGKIKDFLSTIEVKEIDVEKEIEKYAYSLPHSVTGTTSYVSDIKSSKAREFGIRHDWSYEYVEQIAKHFFQLGLKTAQKVE